MNHISTVYNHYQKYFDFDFDVMPDDRRLVSQVANLITAFQFHERLAKIEELEAKITETHKHSAKETSPDRMSPDQSLLFTEYALLMMTTRDRDWLRKMLEWVRENTGDDDLRTLTAIPYLVDICWVTGRIAEAVEFYGQLIEASKRTFGENHFKTMKYMEKLVSVYIEQKRWEEAEELEKQVLECRMKNLGKEHLDTLTSMSKFAHIMFYTDRPKKGITLMAEIIDLMGNVVGEDNEKTKEFKNKLDTWLEVAASLAHRCTENFSAN